MKNILNTWKEKYSEKLSKQKILIVDYNKSKFTNSYSCALECQRIDISICYWPDCLFEFIALDKNDGATLKIITFKSDSVDSLHSNVIDFLSSLEISIE